MQFKLFIIVSTIDAKSEFLYALLSDNGQKEELT